MVSLGLCLVGSPAEAQICPRLITGGPTCGGCSIERKLVTTIHDTTFEGGAIGDGGAKPHVNSDGSFIVITGPSPFNMELYFAYPDGALEDRIGRSGEGPGEYRRPMFVMESESDFLIVDMGLGRITYLSKPTLAPVRTARIPGVPSGAEPVAFPDGSYVMWASIRTRRSAGYGLHHVSMDGTVLNSFGPPPGSGSPDLAASGDSAVWIGYDDYRLERWSLDGELLDVLLRKADWVRPRGDAPEEGEDYSFLSGFSEDRVGRLWVLTVRSRYGSIPTRVGMGAAGDDESIIEVLDPSNGTLIASLWDPKRREWAVPGQGFFTAEARESPEGIIFTDIWTFQMDPGGSHPSHREIP